MACRRVGIVCNKNFIKVSDNYIPTLNRNAMVYALLDCSGLINKMTSLTPTAATFDDLNMFHTENYLLFLKNGHTSDDEETAEDYGFGYDCPAKPGIYDYCTEIAGGSLTAAKHLCEQNFDVVFHWLGGWHHAKRSKAAGYCYINDCVLAILHLKKYFPKVLYVDLDLHHGDGVQDAFCGSNKVMTFSVHKYEPGFFPGSGSVDEKGLGKGYLYTVNLPLQDGARDELFASSCLRVLTEIKEKFVPDAVVCQLGADGINGDPMRSFNLTPKSLESCVSHVINWNLPTLILGGGGYNEANVARCWTRITALVLGEKLPEDIPEHDYFMNYSPDFEFVIEESFKKDLNSAAYTEKMLEAIILNLNML